MANITLAIPEELREKMKKFSELRWSEVVRKAIEQRINDLEVIEKIARKHASKQKVSINTKILPHFFSQRKTK